MEQKIFVTSDTHFGHNREFIWGSRGFKSVQEHDEEIIKRWNEVVGPSDLVYHLGDAMLGDNDHGLECLSKLNGQIYILRGNHDTNTRVNLYTDCKNVFDCGDYARVIKHKGYHFYLSHYPTLTANLDDRSLKQCVLNLFGHTHQQTNFYEDRPYMYHVGMDSHNCYPVLLDEVIEDIINKKKECIELLWKIFY